MQFRRYKQYIYHFAYVHNETQVRVELHWALREQYIQQPPADSYFERSQTLALAGGLSVRSLSDADSLFHSLVHGAAHHWNCAKLFRDWFALLARCGQAEQDELARRIGQYRLERLAAQAGQLSDGFFGRGMPAALQGSSQAARGPALRFLQETARREFLTRDPARLTVHTERILYDTRLTARLGLFQEGPAGRLDLALSLAHPAPARWTFPALFCACAANGRVGKSVWTGTAKITEGRQRVIVYPASDNAVSNFR
jgi:hypothetical protein